MSDTPRTDTEVGYNNRTDGEFVRSDFARELERGNNEMLTFIKKLFHDPRFELMIGGNIEAVRDLYAEADRIIAKADQASEKTRFFIAETPSREVVVCDTLTGEGRVITGKNADWCRKEIKACKNDKERQWVISWCFGYV